MKRGLDIIGRDELYKRINLDERFPDYLVNKQKELSDWIVD